MDIKKTMSKFGFGHRNVKHIIIDHDGELWLTMAPMAMGGGLPMAISTLPGTLRIEPLENGAPAPYTYSATEALLELTTGNGAKVKFVIDPTSKAIVISGNTAFRLNGVESTPMMTTLNTPDGVTIGAGANRYLFAAAKGKISFDDAWMLNQMRSVIPVLNVEPEGGEFELYAFDLPADTLVPPVTKTTGAYAAESSAAFNAFIDSIVDIPSEWGDVKEQIAYPLWLCHMAQNGKEVIVRNKYDSVNTNSILMSIASMAFKDARKAVDMILSCPVDLPPVAGIAATRLLDDGMLNDSRGEIFKICSAIEAAARKCVNERAVKGDELSFYSYRFESGMDRSPEFFKVGSPVIAPDLNAYLIIASEALGKLAQMEYDPGFGRRWETRAKELLIKLIAELWNGEDFVGKNAYTGETSEPDEFLSLAPIILGSRLPEEIVRKLSGKITAEATNSAIGLLFVGGLYDAGEKDAAAELTRKALAGVRERGINCPFYGASLIALAHKVLL